jgi:hypothetical protein
MDLYVNELIICPFALYFNNYCTNYNLAFHAIVNLFSRCDLDA